MKPIVIHSKNHIVTEFLIVICLSKGLSYRKAETESVKVPKSYNGPAIVDCDITVRGFTTIIDYLERRGLDPALYPHDIKEEAWAKMFVGDLLNGPQNHIDAVKFAMKKRNPFVLPKPSIVDVAVAVLSNDSAYKKDIIGYRNEY